MDFIRMLPMEVLSEVYKFQGYNGTSLFDHIRGLVRRLEGKAKLDRGFMNMVRSSRRTKLLSTLCNMAARIPNEVLYDVVKFFDKESCVQLLFASRTLTSLALQRLEFLLDATDKEVHYMNILLKITAMLTDDNFRAMHFVAVQRIANICNEACLMRVDCSYKDLDVGEAVKQCKESAEAPSLGDVCGLKRNDAHASAIRTVSEFHANVEVKGRHIWMLEVLLNKTFPASRSA